MSKKILGSMTRRFYQAIIKGYQEWRNSTQRVFDLRENSITATLMPYIQDAARGVGGVVPYFTRESIIDTQQIVRGLANPNTAPRTDFSIIVNAQRMAIVECKWVDRGTPSSNDIPQYVREGIGRFIPGGRYHGMAATNIMLGYIHDINLVATRVDDINTRVTSQLGSTYRLSHNGPVAGHQEAYQSTAANILQHFFMEVSQAHLGTAT